MNFGLLLPAGLAALGALLLPLLIHLARRSEQRPTLFAALAWLRPKSRPRHRIRFDEWPLLLVRLALLALLALLLARPVLFGSTDSGPRVAVVPGVDLHKARAQSVAADARWLWLTPGFPAFNGASRSDQEQPTAAAASAGSSASLVSSVPGGSSTSITSLLRELDASLPPDAALTVLVPDRLDGVDALRPVLSRRVDWRVLPGAMTVAPASPPDTAPSLVVRYAPEREGSVRFLRAADLAWRDKTTAGHTQDVAPASQSFDPKTRHLAWLVPGPLPRHVADWVRDGGTALVDVATSVEDTASGSAPTMVPLWRDDSGATLVEGGAYGRGRLLRFTRTLLPQELPQLLEPGFPRQLQRLLRPAPPEPSRVRAVDFEPTKGGTAFAAAPRDLQSWLVLLIALAFLVERWLASGARRGASP